MNRTKGCFIFFAAIALLVLHENDVRAEYRPEQELENVEIEMKRLSLLAKPPEEFRQAYAVITGYLEQSLVFKSVFLREKNYERKWKADIDQNFSYALALLGALKYQLVVENMKPVVNRGNIVEIREAITKISTYEPEIREALSEMKEAAYSFHYGNSHAKLFNALSDLKFRCNVRVILENTTLQLTNLWAKRSRKIGREAKNLPVSEKRAEELYEQGLQFYEAEDYDSAFDCFSKAAEAGNVQSQLMIGFMHDQGLGTMDDVISAVYWYLRAADAGCIQAQHLLGRVYYRESGKQDYASARYWFHLAAEAGNPMAQCYFAHMFREGQGTGRDSEQALSWFKKSAEAGNVFAQYTLGEMYEEGEGTDANYCQAIYWYGLAADAGNADARKALEKLKKSR
jgi:hypothetical protein